MKPIYLLSVQLSVFFAIALHGGGSYSLDRKIGKEL